MEAARELVGIVEKRALAIFVTTLIGLAVPLLALLPADVVERIPKEPSWLPFAVQAVVGAFSTAVALALLGWAIGGVERVRAERAAKSHASKAAAELDTLFFAGAPEILWAFLENLPAGRFKYRGPHSWFHEMDRLGLIVIEAERSYGLDSVEYSVTITSRGLRYGTDFVGKVPDWRDVLQEQILEQTQIDG
jgi:hypothetical protein